MWNPEKREKKKHLKKQYWWNNFAIYGDKTFAKAVSKGKVKKSKENIFVMLDGIYQEMLIENK
jgi:hypothetical protein